MMKPPFRAIILCLSIFFAGPSLAQNNAMISTTELISNTKKIINDLKAKLMSFEGVTDKDMAYFESQLNELSTDTDIIGQVFSKLKSQHIDSYFNVERGSFKEQLQALASKFGIDTVRFKNVSDDMDWNMDSAFKLNLSDVKTALNTFINKMPLKYEYLERDNSLTISGLESSQECENK